MAAARARLAGTIITAAVLLVAPIFLWAQFGDGQIQHSIAVAVVATLLCWCFINRHEFRERPAVQPVSPGLVAAPRATQTVDNHARRTRSPAPIRPSRDVGCNAGEPLSERRPARRRSRP